MLGIKRSECNRYGVRYYTDTDMRPQINTEAPPASHAPSVPSEIQSVPLGAAEGGVKLDHWTLTDTDAISAVSEYGGSQVPDDSDKWCLTVIDFGDGELECTASLAPDGWRKKLNPRRKKPPIERLVPKRNKEDIQRSLRRTRKSVRHNIMMMGADKLVTCTTAEPIVVYEDFAAITTEFFRLCRAKYADFKYVAVFERHDSDMTSETKRYSYHLHFATVGYMDYNVVRELWRTVVAKHRGTEFQASNVNFQRSGTNGTLAKIKRSQMARYMSKYVAKDCEYGDACKKRYWSSKNIQKPKKTRFYFATALKPAYFFRRLIEDITGVEIKFCYAPPRESGSHVPVLFFSSG